MQRRYLVQSGGVVPIPQMESTDVETVWHYTDAVGLQGILSSSELHASSALSLNDASEVQFGLQVFREALSQMRAQQSLSDPAFALLSSVISSNDVEERLALDVYIVSASKDSDSLNQWQGYAGRSGYAIGLTTDQELRLLTEQSSPPISTGVDGLWVDVVYDPVRQLEMARDVIAFAANTMNDNNVAGAIHRSHFVSMVGNLAPRFKHFAFRIEEEVRFVAARPPHVTPDFRVGNGGVTPFVKIAPAVGTAFSLPGHPLLSVTGLRCGPNGSSLADLATERAVEKLLSRYGYSASVETSTIPYRF